MDLDYEFGRKLGFKTAGIFRAFKEREPGLYAELMVQKAKYEEATLYLSKQLLTAHKVYPPIWYEAAAVNRFPQRPERHPLRVIIPDVPLAHEEDFKLCLKEACAVHGKVELK